VASGRNCGGLREAEGETMFSRRHGTNEPGLDKLSLSGVSGPTDQSWPGLGFGMCGDRIDDDWDQYVAELVKQSG
jgi:hypothetical protein